MSDAVIKVENVSKKYAIGGKRDPKDDLRHRMEGWLNPAKWFKGNGSGEPKKKGTEDFWALKDVSFEIKQGEVVGFIGRNGAGKSTLLKVLSRITEPTSGRITLKGRVASLLEVGTGFHPELTGRENIFLNGAILGMSKVEIKRKFDEIVAFSEIEKFLETPVKRYSSGMYVRLAFAVAAHLEPEILICDEVLAVGDAEFQKKCMGKMQDVSKGGRTVLFVSHSMAAITRLCQKCALMKSGQLIEFGLTEAVIPHYLNSGKHTDGYRTWNGTDESNKDSRLKIRAIRTLSPDRDISSNFDIRQPFTVEIEYEILETLPPFRIALRFMTPDGTVAFTTSESSDESYESKSCEPGVYTAVCSVDGNLLNEGSYDLQLSADIPFQKVLFLAERALSISVEQTGGTSGRFAEKWPGVVCPQLKWRTSSNKPAECGVRH
ncbi:MAG TPA: ABC transporter ATP-binding protein [Verrucomicrobiae bacterium]|jgi:lipopolysaccharide transport system ATP-binding protein|nr:ABC transporter ATP-binding protein [Verrucomicrobiae bacterium]